MKANAGRSSIAEHRELRERYACVCHARRDLVARLRETVEHLHQLGLLRMIGSLRYQLDAMFESSKVALQLLLQFKIQHSPPPSLEHFIHTLRTVRKTSFLRRFGCKTERARNPDK